MFVIGHLFYVKFFSKISLNFSLIFFLGIGVFGIFSQTLLIFGIYKKIYLLLFIAGCYICWLVLNRKNISFLNIKKFLYSTKSQIKNLIIKHDVYLVLSVVITVLILVILNLVPITTGDAIHYHFPFIKDFILSGQINQPIADMVQWGLGFMPALADIINASFVLLVGQLETPLILLQSAILIGFLLPVINVEFDPLRHIIYIPSN